MKWLALFISLNCGVLHAEHACGEQQQQQACGEPTEQAETEDVFFEASRAFVLHKEQQLDTLPSADGDFTFAFPVPIFRANIATLQASDWRDSEPNWLEPIPDLDLFNEELRVVLTASFDRFIDKLGVGTLQHVTKYDLNSLYYAYQRLGTPALESDPSPAIRTLKQHLLKAARAYQRRFGLSGNLVEDCKLEMWAAVHDEGTVHEEADRMSAPEGSISGRYYVEKVGKLVLTDPRFPSAMLQVSGLAGSAVLYPHWMGNKMCPSYGKPVEVFQRRFGISFYMEANTSKSCELLQEQGAWEPAQAQAQASHEKAGRMARWWWLQSYQAR